MSQALNNKKANALGPGGLGTRWAEVGGQSVPSPPRRPATEEVRFGVPPETKRPGWQLPRRIPPGPSLPSADPLSLPARLKPSALPAAGTRGFWPLAGVAALRRGPRRNGRAGPTPREGVSPCDAGSGPGYALQRAGRPAARPPQLFFPARGGCWGGRVEFTRAKYRRTESAREVAAKSFLLKCKVAGGPLTGSWLCL